MEHYNEELENRLIELVKQKEESDRRLLVFEWVIGILSCVILFVPMLIGALLPMEEWQRIIVVLSGVVPALIGLHFAVKIEQTAGYYQCRHCQHKYVPTIRAVYAAPHMGRTRYMKCPECGKRSWQKKVISKE